MKYIRCPICTRRLFDSNKKIFIEVVTEANARISDFIMKCDRCKNQLSVVVDK